MLSLLGGIVARRSRGCHPLVLLLCCYCRATWLLLGCYCVVMLVDRRVTISTEVQRLDTRAIHTLVTAIKNSGNLLVATAKIFLIFRFFQFFFLLHKLG